MASGIGTYRQRSGLLRFAAAGFFGGGGSVCGPNQFHSDGDLVFSQDSIIANENAGPCSVNEKPQTVAVSRHT
jgi:hypothetical protein